LPPRMKNDELLSHLVFDMKHALALQ
jgi:hypothetical protein